MTSHEDAVARLACAWLLWYPDDRMFERLPDIRAALAELPAQTRDPLTAFLGWLDELAIWECPGGDEDAVRAALPLLAKAAHKRLMTGHSEASGRAWCM